MTGLPWWGDLTLAIAALFIAAGTIVRYVKPAVVGMWRGAKALHHAIQGVREFVEEWRETGGFRALATDIAQVKRELFPNGGTSMRDSVSRCETGLGRLHQQVAAVTDQATAISERQEFLRAADESTAADLRRFLEGDWRETQEANQHLRSALNEVLAVEAEERHGDDRQPPV